MKKKIKVSVIIPVKNEQVKVVEAIQSILLNNDVDISFIIVDDASEDQTVFNVKKLLSQKKINGELIANTESVGAGECRNIGMTCLSEADYVYFFDADDILCEGALDRMVYNAELYGSDVVIGKYIYTDGKTKKAQKMTAKDERIWSGILKGDRIKSFKISQYGSFLETVNYPWNKLLSYDFINEIKLRFSNTLVNNDILAHWHILMSSYQITILDLMVCEHRVYNRNAQITNVSDIRRLSLFEALNDVENLFDRNIEWKKNYYSFFLRFKLDLVKWAYNRIDNSIKDDFMEVFIESLMNFDYRSFLLLYENFPEIAIEYSYLKYGIKDFK